jgi:hypothetical protein
MMLGNPEFYGIRQNLSLDVAPFVDIPRLADEPIFKLIEVVLTFEEFSNLSANIGCVYHGR